MAVDVDELAEARAKRLAYLERLTRSIVNLPTLPTIHARVIEAVDNPRTDANLLGELISEDQVLTAKLLKIVNSSYYGLSTPVTSVHRAIVMLGFEQVKEISLGVSVLNFFKGGPQASLLDLTAFWEHCGAVGVAARNLARRWFPEAAGAAFIAGLLHDLGKVVMIRYLSEDFNQLLRETKEGGDLLWVRETQLLGTHHGTIGYWLGRKWRLPEPVCAAMRHHHTPWEAEEYPELVACVYLANWYCQKAGFGHSGNGCVPVIDEAGQAFLAEVPGLPPWEKLEAMADQVAEELSNSRTMMLGLIE